MKRTGYSIKVINDTLWTIVNNNDFEFINMGFKNIERIYYAWWILDYIEKFIA